MKKSNFKYKNTTSLSSLSLDGVGIYLRDGLCGSAIGIVKLHPSKGTHWVCYINENFLIVTVVSVQRNYLI